MLWPEVAVNYALRLSISMQPTHTDGLILYQKSWMGESDKTLPSRSFPCSSLEHCPVGNQKKFRPGRTLLSLALPIQSVLSWSAISMSEFVSGEVGLGRVMSSKLELSGLWLTTLKTLGEYWVGCAALVSGHERHRWRRCWSR